MPYAHSGDVRIWYEEFGAGEPLVMIMGLGGTVQAWGLQIPPLSQHYRLICLDNRGAGRSDMPAGPYDTGQFAEDVIAVMDAAGLDSAHVLGASLGGLIAQELYHRHPQRVRSLILACTGAGANDPVHIPPLDPKVLETLQLDRAAEPAERLVAAMEEIFYHPSYRAKIPNLTARLLKLHQAAPQPPHAYAAQLAACFNHPPNSPRLARIRVPALVLHGEHDAVWPLGNARYLAEQIPAAELVVIPDSAHMFLVEKPREFNRAVLDFLAKAEARPS